MRNLITYSGLVPMFELPCKSPKRNWRCLERLPKGAPCISLNLNAATNCKMHPTNSIGAAILKQPKTPRKLTYFSYLLAALLLNNLSSSIPITNSEPINESPLTDYDGASFYKAPVGSRIRMACNGSHWATDESVSLVLWFKGPVEGHSVPIYTVDARQHSLGSGQARHLIADHYKGRARFTATSGSGGAPPYLDLGPLEADDQAEYRCRIDYRTKPRENFLVILFVLVPPRSVDITDSTGRSLEQIYGPLSEDSDLTLLCLSKGGRPPPAIRWKRANKLIDDSYLTLNDFVALKRASNLLEAGPANNGTPAPEEASLTSSSSSWPDWRQWPEFSYFSANASWPAQATSHAPGQRKQWAGSGQHEQEQERPQYRQLLTWPVEESVTTSVNVLRLASVNVRKLGPGYDEASRLECEASNLFYDLRALIKLFAPASLVRGWSQQVVLERANAEYEHPSSQLELAIDQALDRALTSSSRHQLEGAPAAPNGPPAATGLPSQQHTLMSQDTHLHPSMITNPTANDKQGAAAEAAAVFQQLLHRPHQLSASLNFTSVLPASASQKPHRSQDQLSLVRTRLITLDIYMRPLIVSISQLPAQNQRSSGALSAGQLAEFSCSSSGSRPPAKLTWFKGSEPLNVRGNVERQFWDSSGENSSDSKLTIRIERQDHGQQLTCRAENEPLHQLLAQNRLPTHQALLEDTRTLNVLYPPQVKLELGNRALSRQVREGADIFFVCHVDANPPIRDILWLHEQQPVNTSLPPKSITGVPLGAVIMSNNSLVLQTVRLEQRGRYACASSNSEGYAESNQLELRVLHTPRCFGQPAQQLDQYSSPKEESLPVLLGSRQVAVRAHTQLECRVEADPPEVEISWYLEGGAGGPRRQISSAQVGSPTTTATTTTTTTTTSAATVSSSKLKYQVQSPLDYGQLFCVAKNQLGEQRRACSWNIEPPDPAKAPPSCALLNVTDSSITAACSMPSFTTIGSSDKANNDRQLIVELYRSSQVAAEGEPSLEANLSTVVHPEEPYFEVNSLRAGTRYTMLIRSFFGQPAAELSFATSASSQHSAATSGGFRLDPRPTLGEPASASLSALISTRSATLADSADWTSSEHRGLASVRPTAAAAPDYPATSGPQSLWSWFRESVLRAVGLEQRPTATESMSSWRDGGDLVAQATDGGASNRMRLGGLPAATSSSSLWPINKPWEPSRWSSGNSTSASSEWFQLLTSASFLGCLLLIGLLAILLLVTHKYSQPAGLGFIWWPVQWSRGRSSKGSATSSATNHSYHQHQDNHHKTHELHPLAANSATKTTNLSSGGPPSIDSIESLKRAHVVADQVRCPNPTIANAKAIRSSTLDRASKRSLSSLIKSRSSFSFGAPMSMSQAPAGSHNPANSNNDSGERIFLAKSNGQPKELRLSQQQLVEPLTAGEPERLGAHPMLAQGLHHANEYDMLTMQLCRQILHSPRHSANPVSLIKSNEPLILTGSSSQPQQAPVVEARDNEQHSDQGGCYQVSCLMHEQPIIDAAQFVPASAPDDPYLDQQHQFNHWHSTNTMAGGGGPLLVGQRDPANFMDQQMQFIELLPGHSSNGQENSYSTNSHQQHQHQLHQQQCMDINLNFVNIVNGTQSMPPLANTAAKGRTNSALDKLPDLSVAQCSLTQCRHQHPPTYLGPNNGSLDCPSLTSSVSPSSSTFKDQSPLSLTTAGQSTVTTSTNYSTSDQFPFSVCSGVNYMAHLEQQHPLDSLALGSLRSQGDSKLLQSLSRRVASETQYLEEGEDEYSGLLVCSHNHPNTNLQQTPIASILKSARRNPPSRTVYQCPPDKLNEEQE